jgi:hypothetical protein
MHKNYAPPFFRARHAVTLGLPTLGGRSLPAFGARVVGETLQSS